MVRKSQKLRPLMARIPEGLRHKLEREAKQNRRSMNAELIHRLTQSFVREEQADLIAATVRQTLGSISPLLGMPWQLRQEAARQPTEPTPPVETDKPKQEE